MKEHYCFSQIRDSIANVDEKKLILNKVAFLNNHAHDIGGAIHIWGIKPYLINVTMCNNFGPNGGGGFWGPDSHLIIVNSIFWNNLPENFHFGNPNIFYSDVMGGWPGTGNINTDPMFVDTANGDYRLQAGSPCIDAGIQDTMIIFNNGQDTLIVPPMNFIGSAPDMGAFEYDPRVGLPAQSQKKIPIVFSLAQNYPNPFNPSTNIEFSIAKSDFVTLKVYNILGEEVVTLVSEKLAAGSYIYDWDASSLASGVYLYRIQAGEFHDVKKMILMK